MITTVEFYVLLADTNTVLDPLAGGGGWVGAGLLGSVLGWLMLVHLPNKDKQIAALVESRDKLVKELSADFKQSIDKIFDRMSAQDKERREDFKEYLAKVVENYEREVNIIGASMKQHLDEFGRLLTAFSAQAHLQSHPESTQKGV